jgi:hypothetical protein
MTWFGKAFHMVFDSRAVKELRQQKQHLSTMVTLAKTEEANAVEGLKETLTQAKREAKYRPSAMASSMGWKPYG